MPTSVVIQQPAGAAMSLVLLFHGVGASAADLVPLGHYLARALPQAQVVSVQAPQVSDLGSGYQWFSVQGVTPGNRAARVAGAMPAFEATVKHWQHEAGVGPDATVIVGFSQGSIMALESTQLPAALAHRMVAIAGRFAQPPRQAPLAGSVHLLHGEQDGVIPAAEGRDAATRLRELGAVVTLDLFPGLGHGVDARVADRIVKLLTETPGV
jgi:phospholipase/carboxylesterase